MSEFEGVKSPSGINKSGMSPGIRGRRLKASDRLHLGYHTGEEDTESTPSKNIWHGFAADEKPTHKISPITGKPIIQDP